MAFLTSKYFAPFMKINPHLPFYQTLLSIWWSSIKWSFSPPYMLRAWERRKTRSYSGLLCFHDSKNLEIGSSIPRLFSFNLCALCLTQILGFQPKSYVRWLWYGVDLVIIWWYALKCWSKFDLCLVVDASMCMCFHLRKNRNKC